MKHPNSPNSNKIYISGAQNPMLGTDQIYLEDLCAGEKCFKGSRTRELLGRILETEFQTVTAQLNYICRNFHLYLEKNAFLNLSLRQKARYEFNLSQKVLGHFPLYMVL